VTIIPWRSMSRNARRGDAFVRGVAEKLFLRIALCTSQVLIQQGRFLCGRANDAGMRK